jgi:circadian clock protein KaiC
MQTPVDASYLADTVIALRYFEATGQLRRAISVVKKRSGAHEDTLRELRLRHGGIVVGEPLAEFHGVMSGIPVVTREDGTAIARR